MTFQRASPSVAKPFASKPLVSHPSDEREREARRMASRALAAYNTTPAEIAPAASGSGDELPDATRRFFEPRFMHDFANVRVHHDGHAAAAAASLGAKAYTAGNDIFFGAGHWAPDAPEGRSLLAHELAHVVQDQAQPSPVIHRDLVDTTNMTINGDRIRSSPPGGVPVRNGTLTWTLEFIGIFGSLEVGSIQVLPGPGSAAPQPAQPQPAPSQPAQPQPAPSQPAQPQAAPAIPGDVRLRANFTPTPAAVTCPTVTWLQTVRTSTDGVPDIGRILITRDPGSGASVDASVQATSPFYGAEPMGPARATRGWEERAPGWQGSTGQTPWTSGGTAPGATHGDLPHTFQMHRGTTISRVFEAAVICIDTAETFASLDWGYTKTSAGAITLLGGRPSDVHTQGATAAFENVRRAFYTGQFQHSLNGFARGSARLLPAHRTMLDTIPTGTATRIVLVGANDNSGGPEANARLSLQRARAAAAYLVDHLHVSPSIITVEAHGVEARVPNPAGTEVPENRRVDVRFEQGAEVFRPDTARPASRAERQRLRRQNPRQLVEETVDWILELLHRSSAPSGPEIQQLDDMLDSLDAWRRSDPTVPDIRTLHRPQIQQIRRRHGRLPRPDIRIPLPELQPPSFIPRIREDTQRVPD